jgi:hypothetical protein
LPAPPPEPFSSQGPTNDGRWKPNLTGPDGTTSLTYGPQGSYGTSFSSPTTAGAAALLLEAFPTFGADQLAATLESAARDIGDPGDDTVFGAGQLYLAAPTDLTPPAAPANLTAVGGDGQVSLNWDDNVEPDLTGYNVYRSTTSGGPYALLNGAPLAASDYVDTAVTNGTTYHYVVTALDTSDNESADSNEAAATPQTPGQATTMHVASIVPGTADLGKGYKQAQALVRIEDNLGAPVPAATVTGAFTGGIVETVAAMTDAAGVATLTTTQSKKGKLKFTIEILNVVHATLTYDPGSNVETSDSK